MRATPPSARMSAGTRSSAITAAAPASSAIFAWSAVTTSMITPPLSISARPRLDSKCPRLHETPQDTQARLLGGLRPGPARRVAGARARTRRSRVPSMPQELRDLAPDARLRLDHEVVRVHADPRRRVRDRRRRACRGRRALRADVPDHQRGIALVREAADRRDAEVRAARPCAGPGPPRAGAAASRSCAPRPRSRRWPPGGLRTRGCWSTLWRGVFGQRVVSSCARRSRSARRGPRAIWISDSSSGRSSLLGYDWSSTAPNGSKSTLRVTSRL